MKVILLRLKYPKFSIIVYEFASSEVQKTRHADYAGYQQSSPRRILCAQQLSFQRTATLMLLRYLLTKFYYLLLK